MTKQKTKVKILSGSSIRLGRGSYEHAINSPYAMQTVQTQNRIEGVAVGLYKYYKTS